MAKIIWVGTRFFGSRLSELGHEIHFVDYPQGDWLDWERLTKETGIDNPDLVLVSDRSTPPFVLGMEAFPCLTAFYAIDSHIHSWYPHYAQAFDLCLVSLKDHLPLFSQPTTPTLPALPWQSEPAAQVKQLQCIPSARLGTQFSQRLLPNQVFWFPPFATERLAEQETASLPAKDWDLLFVGKVDQSINPERFSFLQGLKKLFPGLHWQSGPYRQLFRQGRLLLNHSIAGDLNFRVIEALACGGCLLTPRIGHGLEELFVDGQDLFIFDQNNLPALAKLAADLLHRPAFCAQVAASGLAKVNAGHLAIHRAQHFSDILADLFSSGRAGQLVRERLEQRHNIRRHYLKYIYLLLAESMEIPALREGYLAAALKND